jgi:iron complex outermembrane receptor protein
MRRSALLALIVCALSLGPAPAVISAEDDTSATPPPKPQPTPRHILEEIIVTAQKKEENVQDVPISMSVASSEFMEQQNITDFRELALLVPNAHVDPGNGLFPDVNIRGFGTALSNKAFEQSVGLAIDGIPYGTQACRGGRRRPGGEELHELPDRRTERRA